MSPSVNKLPHLTRLFPHPCIFTLSCQLLNHLFQPKKHKLETFHRRKNPDLAIWVSNLPLVVNSSSNLLSISRIFISKRLVRETFYDIINCYLDLLCSQTGDIVMIETLNALAQFGQLLSQLVPLLLQLLQ